MTTIISCGHSVAKPELSLFFAAAAAAVAVAVAVVAASVAVQSHSGAFARYTFPNGSNKGPYILILFKGF